MIGLCDVCGRPHAVHSCALCGARVCEACFNHARMACKHCARGTETENVCAVCNTPSAPYHCNRCGAKVCGGCLYPNSKVCKRCMGEVVD